MIYLVVSFIISFLISLLLIRLNIFSDGIAGPQKFHQTPVPRAGGLAIFCSLLGSSTLFYLGGKGFANQYLMILISIVPVFLVGIIEDATSRVSPHLRLLGGMVSALLFVWIIGSSVTRVDLPFIDSLLGLKVISVVFTTFAIAGVSHAFNIIDGFNGLASGVAMIVFSGYAYVSFIHNDFFLLYLSLTCLSATLGFFLWNYPFGHIFLGDSGAYLIGYMSAVIGVLLVDKYPDVSPWFPFLLVLYPVWETLFSIYRRRFLKKYHPLLPDGVHFHQLFYRRVTRNLVGRDLAYLERNYFTTPFLWLMEIICFVPAVLLWNKTYLLMIASILFISFYTWLYFSIVRFKTPKIFKVKW